jgi:hypothetical protein
MPGLRALGFTLFFGIISDDLPDLANVWIAMTFMWSLELQFLV